MFGTARWKSDAAEGEGARKFSDVTTNAKLTCLQLVSFHITHTIKQTEWKPTVEEEGSFHSINVSTKHNNHDGVDDNAEEGPTATLVQRAGRRAPNKPKRSSLVK